MDLRNSLTTATAAQRDWATRRAIPHDPSGYTASLDHNLFKPLHPESYADFLSASGSELNFKMRALHSSSALACNVFDYWRGRDTGPLSIALGLDRDIRSIRFEGLYSTGCGSIPANVDVILTMDNGQTVGVESKFLEPYRSGKTPVLPSSYVRTGSDRWNKFGFVKCQNLAVRLNRQEVLFSYLDAAQLLKHALGLARVHGHDYRLGYLWFDVGGDAGRLHAEEIEMFTSIVDPELGFFSARYQGVIESLSRSTNVDRSYITYLVDRYCV